VHIRPYTISQVAVLLLILLLLIYLRWIIRRTPAPEQAATRWVMHATGWGGLFILISLIIGITDHTLLLLLQYLRIPCFLLLFHAIARAFYSLPPMEHFGHPWEAHYVPRLILLLTGADLVYTGYRFWAFWQTGVVPLRPQLGSAPMLLAGLWVLALLLRKLWAAEEAKGLSNVSHLRCIFLAPQSDVGRFYRWFVLVVASLFAIPLSFVWFQKGPIPVWVMVSADLLVMGSLVTAAFVYLRYRLVRVGLEVRVVGAVLIIYLGLVSVLGWLISLAFLRIEGAGIPISAIIGSQMPFEFVTPPAYRQLATHLSSLLQPLVGFEVIGSLFFVIFFALYYRRTVTASVQQLLHSFGQIEQEKLAYRMTPLPWEDEFSQIVRSFNRMAQSLEQSGLEIRTYQLHLQELVEQRTAELGQEIEVRKNLELQQAIQDERSRIARESHDGLLQSLLGVRIRLNRAKQISHQQPALIQAEMLDLAGEVTQAATDLRNLINDLNADILANGLLIALHRVIERQQRTFHIPIRAELAYEAGLLLPAQELNLLRIAQEALTNSCRHSDASEIWVEMGWERQTEGAAQITLEIRDNGVGFAPDTSPKGGWGLRNMRERCEQLGASLGIQSRPGAGTAIRLTVPCPGVSR